MIINLIKTLVLLILACLAIPTVQSEENKENISLIANNTESVISQEPVSIYTEIVELTPIPTDTPTPTATPSPQKTQKVVTTPTQVPKVEVIKYDFKWTPRTALDYTQADKEYVRQRVCAYFTDNCSDALIIAFHESGYRTNAASSGYFSTTNLGVMQINCRWQKRRVGGDCLKLLDLETNLKIAKQIFDEQGWNPWSTKKFL